MPIAAACSATTRIEQGAGTETSAGEAARVARAARDTHLMSWTFDLGGLSLVRSDGKMFFSRGEWVE